jgi:hypothetical protein
LTPSLLALLVMLPRLLSPQFGLLDDGGMLKIAQAMRAGELPFHDLGDGRFRPVYWLWWGGLYAAAGLRPGAFFLANAAVFSATIAALVALVRRLGGTRRQAWLTGVLMAVSGPAIENYYTLSKGEPLQLLLVLGSLHLALGVADTARSRAMRTGAVAILTLLALASKETTLLLAAIAIVWWCLAKWRGRAHPGRLSVNGVSALALGAILGSVAFLLLRHIWIGQPLVGYGYTERYEVDYSRVLSTSVRWAAWLVHDFAYLGPLMLGFGLLGTPAWRSLRPRLGETLVWLAAWLAFYLPWLFVADYYLLPFAAGAAVLAAAASEELLDAVRQRGARCALAGTALGLTALLLLAALANGLTMARLQLLIDSANAQALAYLAAELPPQAVVRVNIQQESEYLAEMAEHLHVIYGRPDLKVGRVDLENPTEPDDTVGVIAAPFILNQVLLSPRLGIYERYQTEDNRRLEAALGAATPLHSVEAQVRALGVDPARLACPLLRGDPQAGGLMGSIVRYCRNAPAIDTRLVVYGWRFYALPNAR